MPREYPRLALSGLLLLSGCGGQTGRFDVSGKVTFGGRPVPAGTVVFSPDMGAGNDGLQGIAEIRDGHFDTRATRRGGPGGAVVVRIEGFDGQPSEERPYGKALFPPFQLKVNLPRRDTSMDFDVPASAATARPQ
jgi:hypothetical protein